MPLEPTDSVEYDPNQTPQWQKSSYCGTNACVGVILGETVSVTNLEDGKPKEGAPVLNFSTQEWGAFILGIQAGEFDPDQQR